LEPGVVGGGLIVLTIFLYVEATIIKRANLTEVDKGALWESHVHYHVGFSTRLDG
jgi:hypothetical protein